MKSAGIPVPTDRPAAPAPRRTPAALGCWLAGRWPRVWRTISTVGRARQARSGPDAIAAARRARIALELHEAVSQHIVAMIVQSEAALFLVTEPADGVTSGLTAISDTGRHALAELRTLRTLLTDTRPC